MGDGIEPAEGISVRPPCSVSFAGHGLLMASEDAAVWLWRRPPCSTETQDGEEATEEDEEEKGRGRSGGEAGGPVRFSFSIMVANPP